jgi:hypothetical protein
MKVKKTRVCLSFHWSRYCWISFRTTWIERLELIPNRPNRCLSNCSSTYITALFDGLQLPKHLSMLNRPYLTVSIMATEIHWSFNNVWCKRALVYVPSARLFSVKWTSSLRACKVVFQKAQDMVRLFHWESSKELTQ